MRGIKAVESQSRRGHFVEHGRPKVRMVVVSRFKPTVVVTHRQNDVGQFGARNQSTARDRGQREDEKRYDESERHSSHGESSQLRACTRNVIEVGKKNSGTQWIIAQSTC